MPLSELKVLWSGNRICLNLLQNYPRGLSDEQGERLQQDIEERYHGFWKESRGADPANEFTEGDISKIWWSSLITTSLL